MTARQYLYHLGKAYRYYHPDTSIAPNPKLAQEFDEKNLLKDQLARIERKCEELLKKKESPQLQVLLERVRLLKLRT